jgi:hypothetical protein
MKQLPSKRELDIMWTVATSSAIECNDRPHIIFAKLLYYELNDIQLPVELADK